MFANLAGGKKLEMKQSHFSSARDFLMTEILIDNGHQASVIANMTMDEFHSTEKRIGLYVITAFKHKEARLFKWLSLYMQQICSCAVSNQSPTAKVFMTWNGGRFTNSGGGGHKCLLSLLAKSGNERACGCQQIPEGSSICH